MTDEDEVNGLLAKLQDPNDETRRLAVEALRGPLHREQLVPLFVSLLETDPYWKVRALACHELYDITFDEDRHMLVPFVPRIAAAIQDPCIDVSLNAIRTLEMLADDAAAALPALHQALSNTDDEIRAAALQTIEVIEGRRPRPWRPSDVSSTG
jgi:HEAT repeat protein